MTLTESHLILPHCVYDMDTISTVQRKTLGLGDGKSLLSKVTKWVQQGWKGGSGVCPTPSSPTYPR